MQASISATLVVNKPIAASTMITISRFLTSRVISALSNLSASWPEVAENSRNGSDEHRADRQAGQLTAAATAPAGGRSPSR